jgi:hypothetical protein
LRLLHPHTQRKKKWAFVLLVTLSNLLLGFPFSRLCFSLIFSCTNTSLHEHGYLFTLCCLVELLIVKEKNDYRTNLMGWSHGHFKNQERIEKFNSSSNKMWFGRPNDGPIEELDILESSLQRLEEKNFRLSNQTWFEEIMTS